MKKLINLLLLFPSVLLAQNEKDESRTDALASCLQSLSPKTAKMVELRYQEGLKPSAIAEKIGWTAEAVYVALSRTRTSLRNCINKQLKLRPQ